MEYKMESERVNGASRKISSYYKCVACNYKMSDQNILIVYSDKTIKFIISK